MKQQYFPKVDLKRRVKDVRVKRQYFPEVELNKRIKGIRVKFQSPKRLEFCIENTEF